MSDTEKIDANVSNHKSGTGNSSVLELIVNCVLKLKQDFFSDSATSVQDFQVKILFGLLVWLAVNLLLINIAWRFYGSRINEKFLKQCEYR